MIWEKLGLVKVYTKKRGAHPDLSDPICLRKGATIEVRPFLHVLMPVSKSSRIRMSATVFTGRLPLTFVTVLFGELVLSTLLNQDSYGIVAG